MQGASQLKCAACDAQVSLQKARSHWWMCTSCGSYICSNCRILLLETGDGICPGTITRGVEPHPPHFMRFLNLRQAGESPQTNRPVTIFLLSDVPRRQGGKRGRKVVILNDEEKGELTNSGRF